MKFKGKILLVVGIMLGLGLVMKDGFLEGFNGGDLVSSITSLVITAGLILGGIILMIIGRNE